MSLALPKPIRAPKAPRARIARSGYIRRRTTIAAKRAAVKAAGYVDPDSLTDMLRFYEWKCAYCGVKPWEQLDHIRPIAKGGAHVIGNIAPSCRECNARKGTSTRWQPKRRHPWMEAQ